MARTQSEGSNDEPGESDDVRRLRVGYEAFARRDYAAMVQIFHPEIELREPPEIPDGSVVFGHQGVIGVLTKLDEAFGGMEFQVRDIRQSGDRILVHLKWVGRGTGSGAAASVDLWHLWWFAEGVAVRMHAYLDHTHALDAMTASAS